MELTEHTAEHHNQIRGVEAHRVRINEQWYDASLLVGAHYLEPDWSATSLSDLDEERSQALIELAPELVIIGVGERQKFLPHAVQRAFIRHGIGIECMTLDAAARTFNVLMSEDRRALAGLIIASEDNPSD